MNISQAGNLSIKDQSKANFYLPFSFMITAFLSLFIIAVTFIVAGPLFQAAQIRTPVAIGVMHLFILGFATMLAMGAVYQLVPVVINEKLYSNQLGVIHYFLFTTGCIGLLIGFFQFNTTVIITSSVLAISGVLIFVINIGLTIVKAKTFNSILYATISSFFYLVLTVVSGLMMGLNFAFQTFSSLHSSLLASHIWFGFIGWFLFLIVGYSFKMLPMFYLAHGHSTKLQPWILHLLHLSLLLLTINFFLSIHFTLSLIGITVFFLALCLYRYHIKQIQRKRFKRNPGKGISLTVYAVDGLIIFTFVSLVALTLNPSLFQSLHFLTAISVFYLFGWVGITILGYLSKIVPFLWWTFCFGDRVGKEEIPSLHNMIDENKIFIRLIFVCISIVLLALAIFLQLSTLLFIAQICLGLSLIYYFIHILAVFTHS